MSAYNTVFPIGLIFTECEGFSEIVLYCAVAETSILKKNE